MRFDVFRRWTRRHVTVVLSCVIGLTIGSSLLALAYFSGSSVIAGKALRFGATVTGHKDLGEDLVWFFCGVAVGGGTACYAWWRDSRGWEDGLEQEHALNRLMADPAPSIVEKKVGSGRGART
jgi:hypothetical protein